jgi:hypothetical protein
MDLVSEGIEAAAMSLEEFRAPGRDVRIAAVKGLVIMYDWWVESADFDLLHQVRKTRPVVFARNRTQKVAPELMAFHVVAIFDDSTFSHYQPVDGWGGYVELTEFLGKPTEKPTDRRRRGFAFVSYVSKDRETVYAEVIPALAACRTGYFDYRFTERLKEDRLAQELERTIQASQIVLAYASSDWRRLENANIRDELDIARRLARRVVAVTTPADDGELDGSVVRCIFGPDREENGHRLDLALSQALGIAPGSSPR